MADVTASDRAAVKHRDGSRCASCGSEVDLTMQHRARVGQGGTSFRVGRSGLLTACAVCNGEYEHGKQTQALVYGWKIRAWVTAHVVPVFYLPRGVWAVLGTKGGVRVISPADAVVMMRAVYGAQWDAWARELPVQVGLEGVRA
ncbi:hypothetical protein [Microbacterium sp. NPDC089696]|uniref:hypothetical protein n=1 Tax=Microbacterium sp. NPDC089696 TaxID=3364199 RepID=UPI0037FFD7FA